MANAQSHGVLNLRSDARRPRTLEVRPHDTTVVTKRQCVPLSHPPAAQRRGSDHERPTLWCHGRTMRSPRLNFAVRSNSSSSLMSSVACVSPPSTEKRSLVSLRSQHLNSWYATSPDFVGPISSWPSNILIAPFNPMSVFQYPRRLLKRSSSSEVLRERPPDISFE